MNTSGPGGRNRRGLTLVETMVVCAVFLILVLTITELLMGGLRAWRKGNVRNELRASLRRALDDVVTEFRQCYVVRTSENVTVPVEPQVSAPIGDSPGQTLTFQRFVRNPSTGAITTSTVTYTFNTSRNTLQRTESGSTVTVAENVLYTDPRDSKVKSFFQWTDSNHTTMYIQLFAVDGASAGRVSSGTPPSGNKRAPEELTVSSAAMILDTPAGDKAQTMLQSLLITPAALSRPTRRAFRPLVRPAGPLD